MKVSGEKDFTAKYPEILEFHQLGSFLELLCHYCLHRYDFIFFLYHSTLNFNGKWIKNVCEKRIQTVPILWS